jgi:hypothetical protein
MLNVICHRRNVCKCAAYCVCSRYCSFRVYTHQNTIVINGTIFVRTVPTSLCEISVKTGYEVLFSSITCIATFITAYYWNSTAAWPRTCTEHTHDFVPIKPYLSYEVNDTRLKLLIWSAKDC